MIGWGWADWVGGWGSVSVVVGYKCGEWVSELENGVWMGGWGCGQLVGGQEF